MKDQKLKIEESTMIDDMDIYLEGSRVMEEEDDEIAPWEVAWMKGYDDAG